jgi:hypothetical protein
MRHASRKKLTTLGFFVIPRTTKDTGMNKKEQFIHVDEKGNKYYHSDREMQKLHREDGPAVEYADGDKEWWVNDKRHREDGPAIECADGGKEWWINDKRLTEEEFNARNRRENFKPQHLTPMKKEQFIHIDTNGNKFYYSDREMKIRHREDGPAIEWSDGDKEWWINDKLHREDGPAIEYADGGKEWWINDKLHREDGPAVEYSNGTKAWYINGKRLTEEEFNARMNPADVELTLDEIAEKFGVSVDKLKIKK